MIVNDINKLKYYKMKNNTVLNDYYRQLLQPSINELFQLVPDMMARKIPRANVQQAFAFKYIKDHFTTSQSMICCGSHEDTCCEALIKLGYNIVKVDPVLNYPLHDYCLKYNYPSYDCVFSVSVIEHVENDEEFLNDMCKLLKSGGTCVLTCDFKGDFKKGDPVFQGNYRFYNEDDLLNRFKMIISKNNCYIDGEIDYSAPSDFCLANTMYTFGTLVIKKN